MALGYDSADELFGRPSHETIHHSHPDGRPYSPADCHMLLPRATGETVTSDLDWLIRRDGSMFPVSYISVPPEVEASLYFAVGEALTNVVKHSQATRAQVTVVVADRTLRIEVRDDGIGEPT